MTSLRRRWLLFAGLCLLFAGFGYLGLRSVWQPGYAWRWLLQALAGIAYLLWVLGRRLGENHRPGETELLPTLGAGNCMTLLRGLGLAAMAGFLFSPRPDGLLAWLPGSLYTLAVAADYLDGYLARVTNHATRLGERLDLSLDGVGVLAAAVLVVQYGQAPAWYLAVALARYAYLAGLWLWQRLGGRVYELSPSVRRRAFAGVQMGFLAVLMWPVFSPPGTHIAAALFALPFLAGFLLDWLAAAGITRPRSGRAGASRVTAGPLPVLLRLAALALAAVPLFQRFAGRPGEDDLLVLALLEAAVLLCILLGAAGRTASIAGLLLIGVNQIFSGLTPAQIGLAAVYTSLLYLGSGPLSMWAPEDRLLYHRAGEKDTQSGELNSAPLSRSSPSGG